jgi:hypothetical protein
MPIINYLDAPAGSGKSYCLDNEIVQKLQDGHRIILAVPTTALAKQHNQALHAAGCTTFIINKDTCLISPVQAILNHVMNPYPEPHVVIITHAALERLQPALWKRQWQLYIDEAPVVQKAFEENLSKTHSLLTNYLSYDEEAKSRYSLIGPNKTDEVDQLASNISGDIVLDNFKDLCYTLTSPNWNNYVDREAYRDLVGNVSGAQKLLMYSILKPKVVEDFASVHLYGANLKASLAYKIWKAMGIKFSIKKNVQLRYSTHPNGDRLNIFYFIKGDWSKTKAERKGVSELLEAELKKHFNGHPFLFADNKNNHPFGELTNAKRLPNSPHGLNDFIDFNNVAYLSARNLTPGHCRFLKSMYELTPYDLQEAMHYEHAYQAVMRCSARDPNNHEMKQFIFPDEGTASYVSDLFPGARLGKISSTLPNLTDGKKAGRPKVHKTEADKQKAYRNRKEEAQLIQVPEEFIPQKELELHNLRIPSKACDETTYKVIGRNVTHLYGSLFSNIRSPIPFDQLYFDDVEEFEHFLRDLHEEQRHEKKEDSKLFSPAFFKTSTQTKSKTKENSLFINGLWLDVEKGGLSPEAFSNILPHLRMTIYSTFSSSVNAPRFRIFIPTSDVMNHYQYAGIMKTLVSSIEDAVYVSKGMSGIRHGIDPSKLHGVSLFYLPGQPIDPVAGYSPFCERYNESSGTSFDVARWRTEQAQRIKETISIENNELDISMHEVDLHKTTYNNELRDNYVQDAISDFKSNGSVPGRGGSEFYNLGCKLKGAGLDDSSLRQILIDSANYANTPKDRRKEIEPMIRKLNKTGFVQQRFA